MFCWFCFNAGRQLAADGVAVNAFLVTNTSTAFGVITWILIEWIVAKHPTMLGAASGATVGLEAITSAAEFISTSAAHLFGILSGTLGCCSVIFLKY